MTKEELENHIKVYRETEHIITELDDKYGINLWNSTAPNFYNNYNLLIHNLLKDIFNEENAFLIEDYIFNQTNLTFDELWEKIKDNS